MATTLSAQHHPRRVPANKSVSLRHQPSRLLGPSFSHCTSNSSGSLSTSDNGKSPHGINRHHSSGETSNVEHWFNDSNLAVSKHKTAYDDNDSPFFIDNHHASDSPLYNDSQSSNALFFPHQPAAIATGTSAEYRSVIDDLTVENKKLRKRLGRFERHRDNSRHLQNEKLFEVKVHGLSSRKKRELEETLRKFALDLNASSPNNQQHISTPSTAAAAPSESSVNPLPSKHTSSMTSKFADSGYGSLTACTVPSSARTSTVRSAKAVAQNSNPAELSEARHDKVQSYLHDIPPGLLPRSRPSTIMTERSKKKLVVQRLEQIFTGRRPRPTGNQQSLQQQEVSQTAADDDRYALEALGRKVSAEGFREARIMDDKAEENAMNPSIPTSNHLPSIPNAQADEPDAGADSPYPQQRPTRPLDLDLDRAQVPADNIRYIRHLGPFSHADGVMPMPAVDSDNWVYFNLLFNLAQLHTINVTTEFVRNSILQCSSRLELSHDGRKVRWKGSDRGVRPSTTSPLRPSSSPRKRQLPHDLRESTRASLPKKVALRPTTHEDTGFSYFPLFPYRQAADNESDGSSPGSDSPFSTPEELASPPSAIALRSFPNRRRPNDGPITFYDNALFCTDLSGDNRPASHPYETSEYVSYTNAPLGMSVEPALLPVNSNLTRPLSSQPPSIEDLKESASLDIDWTPARLSPKHVMFAEPEEPFFLQASGIGGVAPADNFVIMVLRQQLYKSSPCTSSRPNSITPAKLARMLKPTKASEIVERMLFARQTTLKPSPVPEPLMHFSPSSDDNDSDASIDHLCRHYAPPSATVPSTTSASEPQSTSSTIPGRAFYTSSPQSADETEDDDDDQSLDFLAGARVVDPEAIRAEEREFDAEMAERLADEIPAGSSAATAGGGCGSGFDSSDNSDAMEQDDAGSVSS